MNIRELLNDLGIPFKEHGDSSLVTEGWVGIVCPMCGVGTGKTGMGIHVRTLAVSCWKCGRHRLGDSLAAASDRPLRDILKLLTGIDQDVTKIDRPIGRYTEPGGVGPMAGAHRRYLERRGFDPDELADKWGFRGIGLDGPSEYRWRLFMPICRHGEKESWTTRAVGNVEPRYLSAPPNMERRSLKSLLFGFDAVKHCVIVTEGPFDALRIGPGAVATFGLSVTSAQLAMMSRIPVRVVCFDNEPTAQRRARHLADLLTPYPGSTHVATLSGPDPDTSPEDELDELRKRFLN